MANYHNYYYVKKIGSGDTPTTINNDTGRNECQGAVLKTETQVGVFRTNGTNFYKSDGKLDGTQGYVSSYLDTSHNIVVQGKNCTPTRSNLTTLISNDRVKSIFNKFFTNSSGDAHAASNPSSISNWESASNLNAFAYMQSNGVNGIKF